MHRPTLIALLAVLFFVQFQQKWDSLDPDLPNRFMHIMFSAQRTFFATVLRVQHSLLFCLTCRCLIRTKKERGSPLEVFTGYDVTLKILCSFGNSLGIASCNQRNCVTLAFTHLWVRPVLYFPGKISQKLTLVVSPYIQSSEQSLL